MWPEPVLARLREVMGALLDQHGSARVSQWLLEECQARRPQLLDEAVLADQMERADRDEHRVLAGELRLPRASRAARCELDHAARAARVLHRVSRVPLARLLRRQGLEH